MKPFPVLFAGHGSPMNAVADNPMTRALRRWGEDHPRPAAVLCVSGHWYADGTYAQASARPKTIHDFAGFPPSLHAVEYPAPGAPALATRAAALLGGTATEDWGLDHGAWSVLRHLYPRADVPVAQLSLDAGRSFRDHHEMGRRLAPLRREGVFILASGGVVHNLREMTPAAESEPRPWAARFDAAFAAAAARGDREALIDPFARLPEAARAIPTADHYLPFLVALGAAADGEPVSFPIEGIEHGAVSLRAVQWG